MSTRWSTATKFWVLTVGTVLAAATLYRLRSILPLVGLAVVLAYILNPLVDEIHRRTPAGRTLITALVYLGLLALLITVPAIFTPRILEEARAIDRELIQDIISNIIARVQAYSEDSEIVLLGFTLDLAPAYAQLIDYLRNVSGTVASSSLGFLLNFASGFASTLLGLFLMLVLSFYLVKDSPLIADYLKNLIPPPYRDEATGLTDEINQVWRAFFRGQLLLVAVVGFVTWLGLFILGVPNALILGAVAGLLEIIPNLGPVLAAIPGVLVAYFQGSTHLALSPGWFALVVLLLYAVIQQVENTILVPRIIGGSVHLHPVVVLVGVLAGAAIAGILGIFLAAPVLATVHVISSYIYNKLLEPPEAQPVAAEDVSEAESEEPQEEESEEVEAEGQITAEGTLQRASTQSD